MNFLRRYGTYVLQNTKKEPTSFNQLDDSYMLHEVVGKGGKGRKRKGRRKRIGRKRQKRDKKAGEESGRA